MNKNKQCEVENCTGVYTTSVVDSIITRKNRTINVTSTICSRCGDNLDTRLSTVLQELTSSGAFNTCCKGE